MPRLRALLEGFFVFFLGGLVLYLLRHHIVLAYVTGMAVCVVGWWIVWLTERRVGVRKAVLAPRVPVRAHPTPGYLGHATVGDGLVIDPGSEHPKSKDMSHSPMHGGFQEGDLPVHFTSLGPSGDREMPADQAESWVWEYENVTLVNESDEHVTFHAWLAVNVAHGPTPLELTREPDEPVVMAPRETKKESFRFRLRMTMWSEDEILHPGTPKELQLLEDGSKSRKLVVNYEPRASK